MLHNHTGQKVPHRSPRKIIPTVLNSGQHHLVAQNSVKTTSHTVSTFVQNRNHKSTSLPINTRIQCLQQNRRHPLTTSSSCDQPRGNRPVYPYSTGIHHDDTRAIQQNDQKPEPHHKALYSLYPCYPTRTTTGTESRPLCPLQQTF